MNPYLFVYGTLRSGPRHHMYRILAREADFVGDGTIEGKLYDLGDYPGAVTAADEQDKVVGELYRLNSPEETLPVLDEYEGCGPSDDPPHEFERFVSRVGLNTGEEMSAWVYWYQGSVDEANRISRGDYMNYEKGK